MLSVVGNMYAEVLMFRVVESAAMKDDGEGKFASLTFHGPEEGVGQSGQ